MKKIKILTLITSTLLINSCNDELLNTQQQDVKTELISDATVKNGRLYFPNKSSLQFHYDKLKNASEEEIANYIDEKNFLPLRPVLTEKNENLVAQKLTSRISLLKQKAKTSKYSKISNYLNKTTSDEEIIDDIDDLEEIIGDDAYGAFLNNDAEIQVGEDIYKYTDVGLFIIEEDKYAQLDPFLASKNISNDLLVPTEETAKINFIQQQPCNQLSLVASTDIEYFNSYDCGGYTGGGSGGGSTYTPPANNYDQMYNFINNLQNCSPTNGLFDGIFGDSDICIDKYESRYRVKTKAYNYNYYLVYNLGVKVKHQYKGWTGLWRKENCQELRLGVISGQFSYDYSSYFQYPTTQYSITTIYNNNNRYQFDSNFTWSNNMLNVTSFSLSEYPKILQDDIVIEEFSKNDLINQAISAGNKELTADKLNKHFYQYVIPTLGNAWQNLGKPIPDTNNITYIYKAPNYGKILIQKTLYKHVYNDEKLEKSFDWGFEVGFKMDDNGHLKPDMSGSALKKPQEFRVLMYGIAKRNGVWHGSKINTINN